MESAQNSRRIRIQPSNDSNSELNQLRPDPDHKPHDWPQADERYCSCCRTTIIDGLENVVRIETTPEKQLSLDGKELGVEDHKPRYKAYLHAKCWKRHFGQVMDCEKCGGFSRYLKLKDGSMNQCGCTCHLGSNYCSFVLDPNRIEQMKKKPKAVKLLKPKGF